MHPICSCSILPLAPSKECRSPNSHLIFGVRLFLRFVPLLLLLPIRFRAQQVFCAAVLLHRSACPYFCAINRGVECSVPCAAARCRGSCLCTGAVGDLWSLQIRIGCYPSHRQKAWSATESSV